MIKMGDTRNEYRILVRHFTGKIYLTERTNVRIKLHWIFGDRLLGIGGGATGINNVSNGEIQNLWY
jgi:hypothetical protein